jgi:hypothetical protein
MLSRRNQNSRSAKTRTRTYDKPFIVSVGHLSCVRLAQTHKTGMLPQNAANFRPTSTRSRLILESTLPEKSAHASSHKTKCSDLREPHRLLYSQGFNMSPFVSNLFHSFSPRGLRLVFLNSSRVKCVLLSSCIRSAELHRMASVKRTYGELMSKSERFNERLKPLDVRESACYLGNLEFTTGPAL